MSTYKFEDKFGQHEHNLLSKPPYEFNTPIACTACIKMLDTKADVWEDEVSARYGLPKNFWTGYKRLWQK
jgi:hypothetical protein